MSKTDLVKSIETMEKDALEGEVGPKKKPRKYTEEEKLAALDSAVRHGFDLEAASVELGIPNTTIRNWINAAGVEAPWSAARAERLRRREADEAVKTPGGPPAAGAQPPRTLPEKLEFVLDALIDHMPAEWRGREWAIAMGVMVDKWLLVRGMATQRSETLVSRLAEQISPEERDAVINEAERIIAEAAALTKGVEEGGEEETDG